MHVLAYIYIYIYIHMRGWLFFILDFFYASWRTKNIEIGRWWCLVLALIR